MMMIKTHTTQINSENNTEQPLLHRRYILEIPTVTSSSCPVSACLRILLLTDACSFVYVSLVCT